MSETWLTDFEARLETLETAVVSTTPDLSSVISLAESAARVLANPAVILMWLRHSDGVLQIEKNGQRSAIAVDLSEVLNPLTSGEAVVAELPVQPASDESSLNPSSVTNLRNLLIPVPIADRIDFIFGLRHDRVLVSNSAMVEGARAIASLLATAVSRFLLTDYDVRLRQHSSLFRVALKLQQARGVQAVADIVAQDGAAILGPCRISVFAREEGRLRIQACTGVNRPARESETVHALEHIVAACSDSRTELARHFVDWQSIQSPTGSPEDFRRSLHRLADQGTRVLRVLPLPAMAGSEAVSAASIAGEAEVAMIVLELPEETGLPHEPTLVQLMTAAGPQLRREISASESWTAKLVPGRYRRRLLAAGVALLVAGLVPMTFEVEVPGRVVAREQRHLFSPDNGTIEEVGFQNETLVPAAAVLLKISNPDLELREKKLQGEIDVVTARLLAVRSGRLTGGENGTAAEQQQLEVQLKNLKTQQQLVQQQIQDLHVEAPFAGVVYSRESEREFQSRPVQRGQRLLEIVPEVPTWELQLEIPADMLSYVTTAQQSGDGKLPVRYVVRSDLQREWHSTVESVDMAVQLIEGRLLCRATASAAELSEQTVRPGTSVSARIACGRRSLAFVLFREVVEFWQQIRFAWL
ncbi:MAG: hypothetical protein R3C49_15985 [Planctomycetaceae bacterium]